MSIWSDTKEVLSGRRPLGTILKSKFVGYRTIRVALMGTRASGKTVFLTSLANHLLDHREDLFPLGGKHVACDEDAIPGDTLHGLPRFNYKEARGMLQKGEWPCKTTDSSILALRLLLTDGRGRQEHVQLEVVDVPGERIADFAMRGRSYKGWCRWMERSAGDGYQSYLKRVSSASPDDLQPLFDAYRDFLSQEFGNFSPGITPSTVKLGLDGATRGGKSPEEFREAISKVPIGFADKRGRAREFLPIPPAWFEDGTWRGVARRFEKGYDLYVKKVVTPTVDWMTGAEKLFYLVDVLSLLKSGGVAAASEKTLGKAAIAALCPRRKEGLFGRAGAWLGGVLWKTRIRAVYIVATKADGVWSERNRDNLANLASDLFRGATGLLGPGVKSGAFPCAAVCSTAENPKDPGLEGVIEWRDGEEPALKKWRPADVPESLPKDSAEWEERIKAGEFNYPAAFPKFDPSRICPPRQINLDALVELMLAH